MSTTCMFPSALSSQSSSLAVPSGTSALLEHQRKSELWFCAVSGPACSQVHFKIMSSSPVRNGCAHEASSCVCWKAGTEDTVHGLCNRDWGTPLSGTLVWAKIMEQGTKQIQVGLCRAYILLGGQTTPKHVYDVRQ